MTLNASCSLCGSRQIELVWEDEPFNLLSCRACFTYWKEIRVEGVLPADVYNQSYYKQNYLSRQEALRGFFAVELQRLRPYVSGSKLLDVGFGAGIFLKEALDQKWDPAGIEASGAAFAIAETFLAGRARLKLGDLMTADWPETTFDVVTFWDVLAHVTRPLEYMKRARALLKSGGLVVIKTPVRPDAFFKTVKLLPGNLRRSLTHWPMQLWHFSEKSLECIFTEAGLRIHDIRVVPEPTANLTRFPSIWRHPRGFAYFLVDKVVHHVHPKRSCIAYARKE